jgi:hypothetical protein
MKKQCPFFTKGNCRDGDKCKMSHSNVPNAANKGGEKPKCQFFVKEGSCRFGNSCKFSHSVYSPTLAPNGTETKTECRFFKVDGSCKAGNRCRYLHAASPVPSTVSKGSQKAPNSSKGDLKKKSGNDLDFDPDMNDFLNSILKKAKEKQLNQWYYVKQLNIRTWKNAINILGQTDKNNYVQYLRPLLLIYLVLPASTENIPDLHHTLIILRKEFDSIDPSQLKEYQLISDVLGKRLLNANELQSITTLTTLRNIREESNKLIVAVQQRTPEILKRNPAKFAEALGISQDLVKLSGEFQEKLKKIKIDPEKDAFHSAPLGGVDEEVDSDNSITGWYRQPTVEWLLYGGWHENTALQVHYSSIEDYALTLRKLWTQLTFYWGVAAFWPKCKFNFASKDGNNRNFKNANIPSDEFKMCNAPLLCSVVKSIPCCMKLRGGTACQNHAVWTCHNRGHDAICQSCVEKKVHNATFGPGPDRKDLSTDIYDGDVTDIRQQNESLILNFRNVKSRKPPEKATNWKTSYRLQPAGLVGIIKLPATHATISLSWSIYWGEIIVSDSRADDRVEYSRRENGCITVRLLSKGDSLLLPTEVEYPFISGSKVAIVDFRVFVPEVFSVLATVAHPAFLSGLDRLPFKHSLLGLPNPEERPQGIVFPPHDISHSILLAVEKSNIPCMKTLTEPNKSDLVKEILNISLVKTLDRTQLEAFCKGLMSNFHCTQGPPGTGKSYVGVCLVLALNLLRNKLIKQRKSVGPILTLSYKNHALDEFLKDVKDNCATLVSSRGKLIRIGKPELEELAPYTEQSSTTETKAKRTLDERLKVIRSIKLSLQSWLKANLGIYECGNLANILNSFAILTQEVTILHSFATLKPEDAYKMLTHILQDDDMTDKRLPLLTDAEHWQINFLPATETKLAKLLLCWLNGQVPPPRCEEFIQIPNGELIRCLHCASPTSNYCLEAHSCNFLQGVCFNKAQEPSRLCGDHKCQSDICVKQKLGSNVKFCADHLCPLCFDSPKPREDAQSCSKHSCSLTGCHRIILDPFDFCLDHMCIVCLKSGNFTPEAKKIYFKRNKLSEFCLSHKCEFHECSQPRLEGLNSCEHHACRICGDQTQNGGKYCSNHLCLFDEGCSNPRMMYNGKEIMYCSIHACSVCLQFGTDVIQMASTHRATCSEHFLCEYCDEDGMMCDFVVDFANSTSYCTQHIPRFADGKCNGVAKKTGKPCKSSPAPGKLYCDAHRDQEPRASDKNDKLSLKIVEVSGTPRAEHPSFSLKLDLGRENIKLPNTMSCCTPCSVWSLNPAWKCALHAFNAKNAWPVTQTEQNKIRDPVLQVPVQLSEVNLNIAKQRGNGPRVAVTDGYHNDFDEDEGTGDVRDDMNGKLNADEIEIEPKEEIEEEGDQENTERNRLKDLYQEENEEGDEEDVNFDFNQQGLFDDDEDGNESLQLDKHKLLTKLDMNRWNWEMSLEERQQAFGSFLHSGFKIVKALLFTADRYIDEARTQRQEANALALKQASVIGGTIVGAARRLPALRAAEPFAIVVEEACEVMEPTLVSVLAVPSLEKLELIGDQRQLPAFIQNCWYNIEITNPSIKKSLFERLVETEDGKVTDECTLLDVQRRMRISISNLTKSHYSDVVAIIDHEKTFSQKVTDKLRLNSTEKAIQENWCHKGRQVPGLQSSVYFWHMLQNKESKPKAGLSACNENEVQAICSLLKYLTQCCGIPFQCITVITPYQGQKRELISYLRKEKLLEWNKPQPIISTVDRYQGDENDIVILSLVRSRPGNRFVSLLNRFIVASSRGRLGFYIIGSVDAVTEGFDEKLRNNHLLKGPSHWKEFIEHLQNADPKTEADDGYHETRVSSTLPICCSQHPQRSTMLICSAVERRKFPDATNWNAFCSQPCKHVLKCSHPCNLPCHSYNATVHNPSCEVKLPRPCEVHAITPIICKDLKFELGETLQHVIDRFKCTIPRKLKYTDCDHRFTVPCHEGQEMVEGLRESPDCNEIVEDFIQPSCGHRIVRPTCSSRQRYLVRPPLCSEKVKRRRACGHLVESQCHNIEKELLKNCLNDVNIPRPRCGHRFSSRCYEREVLKEKWEESTGVDIEDFDTIAPLSTVHEENEIHLPEEKDVWNKVPRCECSVEFVRSCGHIMDEKVKCFQAFAWSRNPSTLPKCKNSVSSACKFCQQPINIPCYMSTDYEHWNPFELCSFAKPVISGTVITFDERKLASLAIFEREKPLWTFLKTKCQHSSLRYIRSCNGSHYSKISCGGLVDLLLREKKLKDCVEKVPRTLAPCDHVIQVACSRLNDPQPKCPMKPEFPYCFSSCGHSLEVSTCAQFQEMHSDRGAFPCRTVISTILPRCNHEISLICSLKDKLAKNFLEGANCTSMLFPDGIYAKRKQQSLLVQHNMPYCFPCMEIPLCLNKDVVYQRECGHLLESMDLFCSDAFDFALAVKDPPPCKSAVVDYQHPVCNHNISTECWVTTAMTIWEPWQDDVPPFSSPVQTITGLKEMFVLTDLKAFRPKPLLINAGLIDCQQEVMVKFPVCEHTQLLNCSSLFNSFQTLRCSERIEEICDRVGCGKLRTLPCSDFLRKSKTERQESCRNRVKKVCSLCQINSTEVPCGTDHVECRQEVKTTLPCKHEVSWICGKDDDIRAFYNSATKRNSRCLMCNIALWEELNEQVEFELPVVQQYCKNKLLEIFPNYIEKEQKGQKTEADIHRDEGMEFKEVEVEEEPPNSNNVISFTNLPLLLDRHEGAKTERIRRLIQSFKEQKLLSFPPPDPAAHYLQDLSLKQYFDDNYELVFLEMKTDHTPNLNEVGTKRFAMDRLTVYGKGLQAKKLTREALFSCRPADSDSAVRVLIGLVFRCNLLQNVPPFTTIKNIEQLKNNNNKAYMNEMKQINSIQQRHILQGFDCVQVLNPAAADHNANNVVEFIFWSTGTAIATHICELILHENCSICGETFPNQSKDGCFCAKKAHFTCWECFDSYVEAAKQPGAISSYVDKDGHLTCPSHGCKTPYDITSLTSGAPKPVVEKIVNLKIDMKLAKERQIIQKEEKEIMKKELEKIVKMDAFEREVEMLRTQIIDNILTLRCPRCFVAFVDFDGCFALTCGKHGCGCGFCAWCLADCGTDAHSHVPNCPNNPLPGKPVYGELAAWKRVQNISRLEKIKNLLRNKESNVKKKLKEVLKKEFEDLNLAMDF